MLALGGAEEDQGDLMKSQTGSPAICQLSTFLLIHLQSKHTKHREWFLKCPIPLSSYGNCSYLGSTSGQVDWIRIQTAIWTL
jgi:hypothetical protein